MSGVRMQLHFNRVQTGSREYELSRAKLTVKFSYL